jgi:hypothetical protein
VGGNWTHMTDWLPYAALETVAFPVEPPPYRDWFNENDGVRTRICLRLALRYGCLVLQHRLVPHSVININHNECPLAIGFSRRLNRHENYSFSAFHFFPVRCGLVPIAFYHAHVFKLNLVVWEFNPSKGTTCDLYYIKDCCIVSNVKSSVIGQCN